MPAGSGSTGVAGTRSPLQDVTGPADRVDESRFAIRFELASQVPNVDLKDIRLAFEVVGPDVFHDHVPCQDLAWVAQEQEEQVEFGRRELDRPAGPPSLARVDVELEVGEPE